MFPCLCRVFMHRYRDVDEFVRANCVEALGSWILEYPSMFLKDLYTKYLGWMLNDTVSHFVPLAWFPLIRSCLNH